MARRDTSYYSMNDSIQRILKVIKSDPAVEHATTFTGGGGASNTANMSSR